MSALAPSTYDDAASCLLSSFVCTAASWEYASAAAFHAWRGRGGAGRGRGVWARARAGGSAQGRRAAGAGAHTRTAAAARGGRRGPPAAAPSLRLGCVRHGGAGARGRRRSTRRQRRSASSAAPRAARAARPHLAKLVVVRGALQQLRRLLVLVAEESEALQLLVGLPHEVVACAAGRGGVARGPFAPRPAA
jgi:hypothetical protein